MSLENSIKDVIGKKMEDGTVENLISEQLEKGVVNALDNLFRSYGDVTKVIEQQVKSVMIPYLENYDYSKYIVKLDSVLIDVLKNSALDNKKILKNFSKLIPTEEAKDQVAVTELFEKWENYVRENIDTSELEVNYDDSVSYEYVEVTVEFEEDDRCRSWNSMRNARIVFECEKDEEMNFEIKLYRWKDDKENLWRLDYKTCHDLSSLRYINELEIYLMKLNQAGTKIEIDTTYKSDEIEPNAEPEASFS